jgi:multidrug efflux pump subunit AcrA (membrane-fusion protein)
MNRLLCGVAVALLAACFSGFREEEGTEELRVRRGVFVSDVILTGELEAARGAAMTVPNLPSWQTSIKWLATDGVPVKQGERVVELDNSTFTTELDSKRQTELQALQELQQREGEWKADLEQKQLDYETKKSELEKAKIDAGVPRDILSLREYEDRQTRFRRATVEYEKARDLLASQRQGIDSDRKNLGLRLQKAQREIRIAERAIEDLVLRAPRDGIVVVRDIPWEGRKLQQGDTVWVGFPMALIPDLSSLQVAVTLPDVDDGRVSPGMRASVTLDGYPDRQFTGTVTSISAVAQESNRQSLRRAFKVVVNLDRIDAERMRPGLSARVVIRQAAAADRLLVPRASLDLATARVRLQNGRFVTVKVGQCNAQECIIDSGLQAGQRLGRFDEDVNV